MTFSGGTNLQLGLLASAMFAYACSGDIDDLSEATGAPTSSALTASLPKSDCERHQSEQDATTSTTGSTGHIEISDFFIGGSFFGDNTILRAKTRPECVAHIRSPDQALSAAGTLIVSSDFVGTPGGPPVPFAINPDFRNEYDEFPDPPLFKVGEGDRVQIELAGSAAFPPIHEATLRSSAFAPINVTAPQPDSEVLVVSSTAPLKFAWDIPAIHRPDAARRRHPEGVSMRLFALGPAHWGELYCSWPTSAGHGEVAASLLREFRDQLGGTEGLDAVVDVYSGAFREFATADSSYVVFVTTDFATTFPRSTSVTFD